MFFNLFGSKKVLDKNERDKKYKTSVILPSDDIEFSPVLDEEIPIILGENLKKSKYSDISPEYSLKEKHS